MKNFTIRLIITSSLLLLLNILGCDENSSSGSDESMGGNQASAVGGNQNPSGNCPIGFETDTSGECVERSVDCLSIRERGLTIHPPAGVRVLFSVTDCNNEPIRQVRSNEVVIVNGVTGSPFGAGGEGGGASAPSTPSSYGLFSVLSLDMSGSIFQQNAQGAVFEAAEAFVNSVVVNAPDGLKHKVAIQVFGNSVGTRIVVPFTNDGSRLLSVLNDLRGNQESLGSTNLYGAYRAAIEEVMQQGDNLELVERSVVIFTDGVHEAGDIENQRQQSLSALQDAQTNGNLTAFSVYLGATGDTEAITAIRELASREQNFRVASSDDLSSLSAVFQELGSKLEGIAKSNYVVGVCTPVELGVGELSVELSVNDVSASLVASYSTDELNGDVREESCNPQMLAEPCLNRECGAGALAGVSCGTCGVEVGPSGSMCVSNRCECPAGEVLCGGACSRVPQADSCSEGVKICEGGSWVNPPSSAPLAELQVGVCEGALKVCEGDNWVEPMYSSVEEFSEAEMCDSLDNDCDGVLDEDVPGAPLADNQVGVCEGNTKVCDFESGGDWKEPTPGTELCDGLDNDCDGSVDEDIDPSSAPLSDNQAGVCEGSLKVCDGGGWSEPDYTLTQGYGIDDYFNPDSLDNDCNGEVDNPPLCAPNCPDLDFVQINGGSFMMGSNGASSNERPVHEVTVDSFDIMRTELTVAQYRLCVNAGACSAPSTSSGCNWSSSTGNKENHPINCISWFQSNEFAAWVGVRLPTESEWEYAARGEGRNVTYPWGEASPTCSLVDYGGSSCGSGTSEVCTHQNGNTPQGICDMAGNLYEWVQDEYHSNYNGAPNDGSGWCVSTCPVNASDSNYNASNNTSRVVRGGYWYSSADDLRVAFRYATPPFQFSDIGVRFSRSNN